MSPWSIGEFKEFLKDKESMIIPRLSTEENKKIVSLVFEILQAELNCELEIADKQMVANDTRAN